MQVKQAILKLQNQTNKQKSIRETVGTFGVAKSFRYILRKKECTCELNNTKRPRRPQKTRVVDIRRILPMVSKMNPFTMSSLLKNTPQEEGIFVSSSIIQRRLYESI